MDINNNALHHQNLQEQIITLKSSTISSCEVRLFYKSTLNTKITCGIELRFMQDNLVFSSVIMTKHFFLHPTFALNTILENLINQQVHLIYDASRFNQIPYFQIEEALNWNSEYDNTNYNNTFLKSLNSNLGYESDNFLNKEFILNEFETNGYIEYNADDIFSSTLDFNLSFIHCNNLQGINQKIIVDFLFKEDVNLIDYSAILYISDFLLNPTCSLYDFIFKSINQNAILRTNYYTNEMFFNLDELIGFNSGIKLKSLNNLSFAEISLDDIDEGSSDGNLPLTNTFDTKEIIKFFNIEDKNAKTTTLSDILYNFQNYQMLVTKCTNIATFKPVINPIKIKINHQQLPQIQANDNFTNSMQITKNKQ